MPRYDYRCQAGHVTEAIFPMGGAPTEVACTGCEHDVAQRVYQPPAAIHFHGPGFYSTDVKGTLERKRRANPADDLPREHQPDSARIASAI